MEELRESREKADKVFKKKLSDKESLWQAKFEEIEKEITDMTEAHRLEMKSERDRIENRLREQLRLQTRLELTTELQAEFSIQMQEIEKGYQD
jgi:hypothetical protein